MAKKNRGPYSKKQLAEKPTLLYPEDRARWTDIHEPPETFGATVDPDKWAAEYAAAHEEDMASTSLVPPLEVLTSIGRSAVDGYMWQPTALFEGSVLVAQTQGVQQYSEFIDTVDHLHQIGKKVFLYCVYSMPNSAYPMKVRYAVI